MASPTLNNSGIIGAAEPPPGVVPNFVNPDSIGYRIIILNAAMLTLSTLFVSLRLLTRIYIIRTMCADDCMFLPVLCCTSTDCVQIFCWLRGCVLQH
jgi:hypothetical protein